MKARGFRNAYTTIPFKTELLIAWSSLIRLDSLARVPGTHPPGTTSLTRAYKYSPLHYAFFFYMFWGLNTGPHAYSESTSYRAFSLDMETFCKALGCLEASAGQINWYGKYVHFLRYITAHGPCFSRPWQLSAVIGSPPISVVGHALEGQKHISI